MKLLKPITATILIGAYLAAPLGVLAADSKDAKKSEKAKPYTLKTCPVSDEKLGGDMGDPYVFTYQGREIKLCCKDCKKDFDKNPGKYVKKIETAEKKAAKK
jgi:YHS domain-containing protein